jgi:hypothetical protein
MNVLEGEVSLISELYRSLDGFWGVDGSFEACDVVMLIFSWESMNVQLTLPSELARLESRNSLGSGCLFFFPLLPGLRRNDATVAKAAEVTLLWSCSRRASGSGMDRTEIRFLGVLCDELLGEKLRVDEAAFPFDGEAGSEVRRSRPSRTENACETDEGGVTDWSSDELE